MEVSREEYLNWLNDPVTKRVRSILRSKIEIYKEGWLEGKWADEETDDAYTRGLCNGLLQMEVLDDHFDIGG